MRPGRISMLVVALGLSACGDDLPGDERGTIAFSAQGTGALTLRDLATGDERVLDEAGPFGTILFSPDGSEIAYVNGDDDVFIATTNGQRRGVGNTGTYSPSIQWGVGGWLTFPAGRSTDVYRAIVLPGSAVVRKVGMGSPAEVAGSPVDSRMVVTDCDQDVGCTVTVEQPDGQGRVTLATGVSSSRGLFSPDGERVVMAERVGDEVRSVLRSTTGDAPPIDLGPGDRPMYSYEKHPGLSVFSPDGAEVLSRDGEEVVALRTDGGGARVVIDPGQASLSHVGFTPGGSILIRLRTNTEVPPDDTPEFAFSTLVADPDGTVRTLRDFGEDCEFGDQSFVVAAVPEFGTLVAYECGIVQRIEDGAVMATFEASSQPLGFTPDGGLIAISGTMIVHISRDGMTEPLAETYGLENRDVDGRLAAYSDRQR